MITRRVSRSRRRRFAAAGLAALVTTMGAPATAQIIDENSKRLVPNTYTDAGVEFFTDAEYASNALAIANLESDFEFEAVKDIVWSKGVSVSAVHQFSPELALFAGGTAVHVSFLDHKALDFVGLAGMAGIEFRPAPAVGLYAGGTCASERDADGLKQYYGYCGPAAGLSLTAGRRSGTHLSFDLAARKALGDRKVFARFDEASASLRFETGGPVRLHLQPAARIRRFGSFEDGGITIERKDYRAMVSVGLRYVSRRFEGGVAAQPSVNWSDQAQYRFWDVRGGPFLKLRF